MTELQYDILENDGETVRASVVLTGNAARRTLRIMRDGKLDADVRVGTQYAGVIITLLTED
jgi:hypothetical protein